jgi:hypothetical protein
MPLFLILFSFFRLEAVQLIFVVVGAGMGALGLMILFVGCLATGATRIKVYRAWRARVGGRISCAVVGSDFILYTENSIEYYRVQITLGKQFSSSSMFSAIMSYL